MVEQRKPMANYYNSWKFTGKELDSLSREAVRFGKETGLYYFGARYYQPSWSILALSQVEGWLSVDPLAEEMPEWTPYHYVFNNPLNLVDPDGLFPNDPPGVNPIIKAGLSINFGGKDKKTQYNFEAGLGAIFDKPIDLNNEFKQSLTFMVKTNNFFSSNASFGIEVKTTYTNDRYVDKLSFEMKEYLPINNVDGQNPPRFSLSGSYTFDQGLDIEQAPLFDNKIGFKASTEDGMEYSFFGETRGSSDVNFNIKPKLSFEVTSRTFENFEFNSDFKFENLQLRF